MAFTVTRAGATDAEFVEYVRVLRQHGKPQAIQPRVPDPEAPTRRWVPVWDTEEEARAFVSVIDTESSITSTSWRVVRVDERPTLGPLLSPLPVQIARQAANLLIAADLLGLEMIRELCPTTCPCASFIDITTERWNDFRRTQGELDELVKRVLPVLTGLDDEQLAEFGFVVIDGRTDETLAYHQPPSLARLQAGFAPLASVEAASEVA